MTAARGLVLLVGALLLFRAASALVVFQPGYTDAYYYADVAQRLAGGQGLTADFIWNFLEAPFGGAVPVASHRFWMPLVTVIGSFGISLLPVVEPFRAAQVMEILIAACIPVVTFRAARAIGASDAAALVAAAIAGLGGAFAPGWVSLDAFAPAALIGTMFFLSYRRAALADGDLESGAFAGLLVGLLFLARAEGALFGLPLLALVRKPRTRVAGIAGSVIALAIGGAWVVRNLTIDPTPDLIGRSVLLVRYEDFFATTASTWPAFTAAMPAVLAAKVAALGTNAVTFLFVFGLLLVPGIVVAVRARGADPMVRAFAVLLVLVYVFESLVVTLHSTHGSYFHSLAAFLPLGVALGVAGTAALLGRIERGRGLTLAWTAGTGGVAAALVLSVFALMQWDDSFNAPYRTRLAQVAAIPPGRFMAIDAAAWRWISRRPVLVTPADFGPCAFDRASLSAVKWLVLEPIHFSAYDALYRDSGIPAFLSPVQITDGLRVYGVDLKVAGQLCTASR
ncbi:MAG TPA: hypothetical protein VGA38_06830 [Candidatus Limnocylindria bacterium]